MRLFSEAALIASISVYLPVMLGLEHAGMISVFLVAAALSDRLTLILEENRRDIWEFRRGGWASNRTTATAILLLFLGMFVAYLAIAYTIGESGAQSAFSFTSQLGGNKTASVWDHEFGAFSRILLHNIAVLVAIAFLAFLYRSYGVMLVLAWNACVWGFVFASLTLRSTGVDASTSLPALVLAYMGVLPHLVFESTAYVLVSLAFLFGSKALGTYTADDPRLRDVVPAALTLMGLGVVALVLAALAEAYLAPLVLGGVH